MTRTRPRPTNAGPVRAARHPEARGTITVAQIHADLMDRIRSGQFVPGARLPNERQLAQAYGTSRQQVRDAMLLLEDAALVSRWVGSGTYLSEAAPKIIERIDAEVDVHAKHAHSFVETIEARLILEPGVAALAARNISREQLVELESALESVRSSGSWLDYKSRIYLFARAYYVASGNSFLLRAFDQILQARQDHKFDGHRETGAVAEIVRRHSYDQLRAVYEAIAARDEARAEAVTRTYLIGIAASSGLS
jgi:DNA-binding FadR family transcriptional regulator